jgi:WhiB family redox-sensing transcriptional regulator
MTRRSIRPDPPAGGHGWRVGAACRTFDIYLFFGPDGERQPERDVRERKTKAICSGCPVRNSCLNYALDRPEKYGTWGGLNEDERAAERRRRMRRTHAAGVRAEPDSKRCTGCQEVLPADAFYRDATAADGLASRCRPCRQKQVEAKQEAVA